MNDENEINEYFSSPSKALLKTVIISLTGEIEFEDLVFGGTLGWMIFLFFVFLIMLVLVNLLNGLAISDITLIQEEAEIMSHISRVELIYQIELVYCQLAKLGLSTNDFMLFNKRLTNMKALFKPNESNKEQSQAIKGCRGCTDLELPESILREAKSLVIKKDAERKREKKERWGKEEKERKEKEILDKTHERLSDIEKALKDITSKSD